MKELVLSISEMKKFAFELAGRYKQPPLVVLLSGPMGAGKTHFAQFFVEALIPGVVAVSPTFAIHNEYGFSNGVIHHFDIHRIENDDDLESTGFWDVFDSDQHVVIVEWADRLEDSVWPIGWSFLKIKIQPHIDLKSRQIYWTTGVFT